MLFSDSQNNRLYNINHKTHNATYSNLRDKIYWAIPRRMPVSRDHLFLHTIFNDCYRNIICSIEKANKLNRFSKAHLRQRETSSFQ